MRKEDPYEITIRTWNKLAQLYHDKFMDLQIYDETYNDFCEMLLPNSSVLELGCGPGNITRYLLNKRPDLSILATDVSEKMVKKTEENIPSIKTKVLDAREVDTLDETYDGIMCGFCIPYLNKKDVQKLLSDSNRLVKDGGILYLSVADGSYANSSYQVGSTGDRTFFYYYNSSDITSMLSQYDFAVISEVIIPYPTRHGVDNHLIFIARRM